MARRRKPPQVSFGDAIGAGNVPAVVYDQQRSRDAVMTPSGLRWLPAYGSIWGSDTNPDNLTYAQLDRLRKHHMVSAGLVLVTTPIISQTRAATVLGPEPHIRAWVKSVLIDNGILYRATKTGMRSMWAGAAFHEKVFTRDDITFSYEDEVDDELTGGVRREKKEGKKYSQIYKEIRELHPDSIKEILHRTQARGEKPADGSYDGFRQKAPANTPGADGPLIPAFYSFLYSHDPEYGNLWGVPRTRNAYPYFWWQSQIMKIWMSWAERKVVPPRKGRHPVGKTREGVDFSYIITQVANLLDSVSTVALPSTRDRMGNLLWDIEEMSQQDRSDAFKLLIDALDIMILRSMFVPERTFMNPGDTGTYAEAMAHTDTFLMTLDAEALDFMEAFNRFVVRPIVHLNWGAEAAKRYSIVLPGLSDEERIFLKTIFTQLLNNKEVQAKIAVDLIAERFGVPLKDVTDQPAPLPPGQQPPAPGQPGSQPPAREDGDGTLPNVTVTRNASGRERVAVGANGNGRNPGG